MIKTIYGKDLFELAKSLIDMINNNHDFFQTPICVFKNKDVEKWFKTYYLKTRDSVLMNVLFSHFLGLIEKTSSIKGSIAYKSDIKDALLSLILKGKYMNNYLNGDDGKINCAKLIDFCNNLSYYFTEAEENLIDIEEKWINLYSLLKEELKENNKYLIRDYIDTMHIKNINAPIYVFMPYDIDKIYLSYLNKLQETNDVYLFQARNEERKEKIAPTIVSAPSMVREIEWVHSKICELLKRDDVSLSDIVVVSPVMDEYVNAIRRVFRQDDINYPDIPYVIKTTAKHDSNLTSALRVFFNITRKGFYTRLDLYELACNPLIAYNRGITDDFLKVLIDTIDEMNIYRHTKDHNDFHNAVRRITLSKLVGSKISLDNQIEFDDSPLIPYGSIDLDDEKIVLFNSLVNDLDSFLEINEDNYLDLIEQEFDKWFIKMDDNSTEQNKLYLKVLKIIHDYKELNSTNKRLDILFTILINDTMVPISTFGEILTSGITFMSLRGDAIIPSRFCFMIGMNANVFPRKDSTSEFYSLEGLMAQSKVDSLSFYSQAYNTKDELFISYLSQDLKADKELYPSSLLKEIINNEDFVVKTKEVKGKIVLDNDVIDIDETRKYSDLYTRREYKNKEYYINLFSNNVHSEKKDENEEIKISSDIKAEKYIKDSDLKNFLEEPFAEKTNRLMKKEEDKYKDIKKEYEELDLKGLRVYNVSTRLIKMMLDEKEPRDEDFEDYLKTLKLSNEITGNEYGDIEFTKILDGAKKTTNELIKTISDEYAIRILNDLTLGEGDECWTLHFTNEFYYKELGSKLIYAMLRRFDGSEQNKDYLYLYLYALGDVARKEEGISYNVVLFRNSKKNKEFVLTKAQAIETLNKIYKAYIDFDNIKYIPINNIEKDYDDIRELSATIRYAWEHFENKDLFDKDNDIGYSESGFLDEWKASQKLSKELLLFLGGKDDE